MMQIAKLFMNGRSQAVRLPKQYRFSGEQVFVKKWGDAIVLIPYSAEPWQPWFDNLDLFSDDFMDDRAQPPQQDREDLFA